MPTTQFYPQSGGGGGNATMDGYAARAGVNQTLAAISAGAGTESDPTVTTNYCELDASTTSEQYAGLYRSILTIDTSSLTADADIVSATLNIYVTFSQNDFGGITFNVVGSTPASNNDIVDADYAQLGTTKFSSDTSVTQTTSAYLSIPLNASGLAAISKTGITKLGLRLTCDGLGGSDGTWTSSGIAGINSNSADAASNKPYLEVVYTTDVSINSPVATINIQGLVPTLSSFVTSAVANLNIQALIPTFLNLGGWLNQTKNSATASNTTKHSSSVSNQSKNSGTWTNQDKT